MVERELAVQIDEGFTHVVSEAWLRRVVAATLEVVGLSMPIELGVLITNDATVQELNAHYRDIDELTDVLSFAFLEPLVSTQKELGDFSLPPDGWSHLGEVVVSYPRTLEQAQAHGHSVERELALLVAHGVLHLLGYDHQEDRAATEMQAQERRVLNSLGFETTDNVDDE